MALQSAEEDEVANQQHRRNNESLQMLQVSRKYYTM
jgi:hypothetical protein